MNPLTQNRPIAECLTQIMILLVLGLSTAGVQAQTSRVPVDPNRAVHSAGTDFSTDQLQLDLAKQTDVAVSATELLESVQTLASAPVDVVDILFDADRTPAERVEAAVQALQAYFFAEVTTEPLTQTESEGSSEPELDLIPLAHASVPLPRVRLDAEHIIFAEVPTEGVKGRIGFNFMGQVVSTRPGGDFVIDVPGHRRTRFEVGGLRYLDPQHKQIEVTIVPLGQPPRRLVWQTA